MNTRTLTCDEFSDALGDRIDGTSDAAARAAMDAHAATCAACAALFEDVRSLVGEARALPELAPSRDLWAGIESRIAAPVLALDATAPRRAPSRRTWSPAWMSAAAAALVVATAAITYSATKAAYDGATPGQPVAAVAAVASPSSPDGVAPGGSDAPGVAAAGPAPATSVASTEEATSPALAPNRRDDAAAAAQAPAAALPVAAGAVGAAFDTEIEQLRTVLERRRGELDPATVAILEHNLGVIDRAIEQSRAALVRDPANRFLTDQLNSTLGKKVELLRTAAMLPARI